MVAVVYSNLPIWGCTACRLGQVASVAVGSVVQAGGLSLVVALYFECKG
jgi:hypothetical protein